MAFVDITGKDRDRRQKLLSEGVGSIVKGLEGFEKQAKDEEERIRLEKKAQSEEKSESRKNFLSTFKGAVDSGANPLQLAKAQAAFSSDTLTPEQEESFTGISAVNQEAGKRLDTKDFDKVLKSVETAGGAESKIRGFNVTNPEQQETLRIAEKNLGTAAAVRSGKIQSAKTSKDIKKDIRDVKQGIVLLDEILREAKTQPKLGLFKGTVEEVKNKFGRSDPKFTKFATKVKINIVEAIKKISGTAVSAQERKYLLTIFPGDKEGIDQIFAKGEALIEFARVKQKFLEQGLDQEKAGDAAVAQVTGKNSKAAGAMSDTELLQSLGM